MKPVNVETHNQAGTFNQYGHFTGSLPGECISDCSAQGAVDESVTCWRKKLNWTVPREMAIQWLSGFGAWPLDSDDYDIGLNQMSDDEIADKVLWIACCEIKEHGDWFGLCN